MGNPIAHTAHYRMCVQLRGNKSPYFRVPFCGFLRFLWQFLRILVFVAWRLQLSIPRLQAKMAEVMLLLPAHFGQ